MNDREGRYLGRALERAWFLPGVTEKKIASMRVGKKPVAGNKNRNGVPGPRVFFLMDSFLQMCFVGKWLQNRL